MTMQWPFSLARPANFGPGAVPTPDELQTIQEQAALAADGRLWTDIAAIKRWTYANPTVELDTMVNNAMAYDPTTRRWFAFGTKSALSVGVWTISGARWNVTAAASALNASSSAACSPAGKLLVGGFPTSGASSGKIVESTNGGGSWTTRNIGPADGQAVTALAYSTTLSLWLASCGGNTGTGIHSSPDGITWTLRGGAGGPPLFYTINETGPVIIGTVSQAAAATTGYFRSTNGTTWTTETFPATLVGSKRPTFDDRLGRFVVPAASGVYTSTTGLTGSWTLLDASFTTGGFAQWGRMLIRGDGRISLDSGATWSQVLEVQNNDLTPHGVSGVGVLVQRASAREVYLSGIVGL
jgi:hypothetical protein